MGFASDSHFTRTISVAQAMAAMAKLGDSECAHDRLRGNLVGIIFSQTGRQAPKSLKKMVGAIGIEPVTSTHESVAHRARHGDGDDHPFPGRKEVAGLLGSAVNPRSQLKVGMLFILIVGITYLASMALLTPHLQTLMGYPVVTAGIDGAAWTRDNGLYVHR